MTNVNNDHLDLEGRLLALQQRLAHDTPTMQDLYAASTELSRIADDAGQTAQPELARGATLLARVLELAACWSSQPEGESMVQQLTGFFRDFVPELQRVAEFGCDESGIVDAFTDLAEEKWSDYLELLDDRSAPQDDWNSGLDTLEESSGSESVNEEPEDVNDEQIELLLSAVCGSALPAEPPECQPVEPTFPADTVNNFELDRELLEAYLDDANRCLSSMEQAALAMETASDSADAVPQFCRELHTLKGASATVGLSELASYLHELESSLHAMFSDKSASVTVEPLFEAVDRVRTEIAALTPKKTNPVSAETDKPESGAGTDGVNTTAEFAPFTVNDDSSIRIRAAKLDRLMDMLAELVVLRNRRESNVGEFNVLNKELAACVSRLNLVEKQQFIDMSRDEDTPVAPFPARNGSNTLSEVAEDIAVLFKGLRDLQKPVNQDNLAISRFIRDFRQELMQLRRIPVSGLFNRLQRAARDAAKQEHKQVQVKLVGQDAGLEQEIQERLFESLLHIVRNAVSHGIESEAERKKHGKNPVGTVTLEANSNAQLLVIEVRDDGNGIDYKAVRRRAIEKGLLSADKFPSNAELAELIFHPGFSTREKASEVSGRGVGMNVVATTLNQLHGRVEVDSVSGQGSTMRLLIPLRTGIEHVMVFRCEGQLFALPMESVTAAKTSNGKIGNVARLTLSSVSPTKPGECESANVLMLKGPTQLGNSSFKSVGQKNQVALAVDELIGPEEVVVRGLPNLLKRHPLFCGVTLSGSGESVLLLNAERVLQFCEQQASRDHDSHLDSPGEEADSINRKRALVVDDSLTARRVLVKLLQKHEFTTVEAGDGMEAIEILHRENFDLVLTDLDMPRLGGLELLADIQSSRFCDAPVAVVSSRDEETFRSRALDLGATEYVTKPVSEKSITQLLESLELLPENQKG